MNVILKIGYLGSMNRLKLASAAPNVNKFAWEAGRYSHTVEHRNWEHLANQRVSKVLRDHGTPSMLVLIGISNGGMVACHVAQELKDLQPRLWLASGPPASFQLASQGYAHAPLHTVLTAGWYEGYLGGYKRIADLCAPFAPKLILYAGRHARVYQFQECVQAAIEWLAQ